MNEIIILLCGAGAVGLMYHFHRVRPVAGAPPNAAMMPPVMQLAGNPRTANGVVQAAGCAAGAGATVYLGAPPLAPLGCAVGAKVAGAVLDGTEYVGGKVASGVSSAWHSISSIF